MFTDFDINAVRNGERFELIAHELAMMGGWLCTGKQIPGAQLMITEAEWESLGFTDDDWVSGSELLKNERATPTVQLWVKSVSGLLSGELETE